jgi:subtilisin family serine protease
VLAVGAVGESGHPSLFSTRGDHVALCAPGEHVRAAALDGYDTHTGTSFAAPFVAGACALLLARAARYGTALGSEAVRRCLVDTARPFSGDGDHTGCGAGILDIAAALAAVERTLGAPAPARDFHLATSPSIPP